MPASGHYRKPRSVLSLSTSPENGHPYNGNVCLESFAHRLAAFSFRRTVFLRLGKSRLVVHLLTIC